MFQKNLGALKSKNPELAKKLEGIDINTIKDITAVEAESGDLIITYKETPLHNTVDPIREANTVWNRAIKRDLKKNDIQMVFGLGLGYLFKRACVNSGSKVFLLEPKTEILRFVLEYVDFANELSDDRVFITDSTEDLLKKLQSEYLAGDLVEFLFLNSYAAIAKDELVFLTENIVKVCESKGADQSTILNTCKFWTKNSILNMPFFIDAVPAGYMEGKLNKNAALIVSAGPSLTKNLEKIKQNKDKFIIIAVASAFKILVDAGIEPDFVSFADPNVLHLHVEGYEEHLEKTNLLLGTRADNYIFKQKANSKVLYFSETDNIAHWVKDLTEEEIGIYKSGGTVSIISYYFAKSMGCNPIIFAGLDLAFIDGKIYADNTPLEVDSNGVVKLKHFSSPKKLTQVKGVSGEMIPSRDDYAIFVRHFEEIFAEPTLTKVINTATSGAFIKGVEYKEFDEALELVKDKTAKNIDGVITETKTRNRDNWFKANKSIIESLEKNRTEVTLIEEKIKPLFEELKEINELFESGSDQVNLIQSKIQAVKDDLVSVRNEIMENTFLSYYLQSEVWEYTRTYKMSIIPSANDIKSNMKTEYDFYNMALWATNNISEWIDASLSEYKNMMSIK